MEENSDGHLYCWIEKLFGSPNRSGNESAHHQQQTNLLEKTCKRILSDNFYSVIHLFIYCGWKKKKTMLSSLSLLLLQTMILLFKAKTNKNVL